MNTRDAWADLAAEFPEVTFVDVQTITQEQLDAMAAEYQREQIASAQSEAAWSANVAAYNKGR